MLFEIINIFQDPPYNAKSKAYLNWDEWNDFSFFTLYHLIYVDDNSIKHNIGDVKIGFYGQEERERRLKIGDKFEKLHNDFFSLGQSEIYYELLNGLGVKVRDEILFALNDIAKLSEVYEKAIQENVTKISLLRHISPTTVTGQFRRLASGGTKLTEYSFRFVGPKAKDNISTFELDFRVKPESYPPTNIHVLIGRNGVGKTFLINNMIDSLLDENLKDSSGKFIAEIDSTEAQIFANLTSVTFSAFDETEPRPERKDNTKGVRFSYIGLKRLKKGNERNIGPKSTTILRNEFYKSLILCQISNKTARWKNSIEMLEADPYFKDSQVKTLIDFKEKEGKQTSLELFKNLSSGHKIILLTITRLIETLQEKSLVLIDEPEAHLHPPLLSAFIRTLSALLIETNSVAIIATHSPVILQEVPKSCVWKIKRMGEIAIAERLTIESFGENVGTLTNEVFGLEVTNSGFYKIINEAIKENDTYESIINYFNNQLGMEAKAIIMSLIKDNNK